MTFEQAFVKIKDKFSNVDLSKLTEDFAIQVNMTDEDCGGAFYIQFADGKLNIEPYDYRDNTADVTLKKMDLYKILDGKLSVQTALEKGKLYVNGNAEHLSVAAGCIVIPEKKTTKKPAEKKTVEKKPAEKKAPAKKTKAKPETKEKGIKGTITIVKTK